MNDTNFIICCRRLVGALRQSQQGNGHATFFLGFDAQGLPFYASGSLDAGPRVRASAEPLFFCPFCGRSVREGAEEAAAAARRTAPDRRALINVEDEAEELTLLAAEADEQETVFATRRTFESGARGGAGCVTGEAPAPHFIDSSATFAAAVSQR